MYPTLLGWIIIGIIASWVTGKLMRGAGYGILMDLIVGLIGAVIGGWIFGRLGILSYGLFGSLAAATVGAVIVVVIARLGRRQLRVTGIVASSRRGIRFYPRPVCITGGLR